METKKPTSSPKLNSSSKDHTNRKNDPGVGGQYEINVSAYFALKLYTNKDVKDFSIQSNVSAFGNLDDIIVDVQLKEGSSLHFAFQLKHREKNKTINSSEFESPNSNLGLERYCTTFKNMPEDLRQNYHYILYTCQNFKRKSITGARKFTMCEDEHCPGKVFFDTSVGKVNTYKFGTRDGAFMLDGDESGKSVTESDYQKFFSKFTLYTCQRKFQGFERLILDILKQQTVVNNYMTLFRKWHQGLFTNKTIDRKTINAHLVDIYLSSSMILNHRLCDNNDQKLFLFEQTVNVFDVTIIEKKKKTFLNTLLRLDCDNLELKSPEKSNLEKYIRQYTMQDEATLPECLLRLAKEHKFIEKTEMELNDTIMRKMFCFFVQNSIIVGFNQHCSDSVYRLMQLYRFEADKIKIILVGFGVDPSKLSSIQVYQNLADLSTKNNDLYQQVVEKCKISLQGGPLISLKELFGIFEDAKRKVETVDIVETLKTSCRVGEEKLELPQHYIPRKVSATVVDSSEILNATKDGNTLVVVDFGKRLVEIEEDIKKAGIDLIEISQYIGNTKSVNKPVIISTEKSNFEKEFAAISSEPLKKSIHAFKMITKDAFILIKSTSKFNCGNFNTKSFPQEEIHSVFDGTLNLLVAEPGMGKTTFMKYLRNEYPWNFWKIYIDLKSHATLFSKGLASEQVLEHLMKTEQESSFLGKLQTVYRNRKKLVLFLDGLDELPDGCAERVLEAVENFSHLGIHVWLASRKNLAELLSKRFNLFSLRMVEFGEEEQKMYFRHRLGSKYKETDGLNYHIFNGVTIADNKQFLGTPLQLYILTQMLMDGKPQDENITEVVSVLTNLYKHFFSGRYRHCFEKFKDHKRSPFVRDAEEYLEKYEVPALESILGVETFKKLKIDCRANWKFLLRIQIEKDPLGIISKVETHKTLKAVFEHRSYAEYFACVWLRKNPEKVRSLKHDLFSQSYESLRDMLNMMVSEKNPLHLAIIYKDLRQLERHIDGVDALDEAGRTALHIACCSNTKYVNCGVPAAWWYQPKVDATMAEDRWYTDLIDTLFEKNGNIFEKDKFFKFDCLQYACASRCLYPVEVALKRKLIKFSSWKRTVCDYYDKYIWASQCVEFGYPNLLKAIISETPKILKKRKFCTRLFETATRIYWVNSFDNSSERHVQTVEILMDKKMCLNEIVEPSFSAGFHMACKSGRFTIVRKLSEIGMPIDDNDLNTALHLACQCDRPNVAVINWLMDNNFDIGAPNRKGITSFHLACQNRYFQIVERTLNGKNRAISGILQARDDNGNSSLHYAAKSREDNKTVIDLLIKNDVDVNCQNGDGCTPLHLAVTFYNVANITKLLEGGADVNIPDVDGNTALAFVIDFNTTEWQLQMIDLFTENHYKINSDHGTKVLNIACRNGDVVVVEKLIKIGTKFDDQTLHYASESRKDNTEVLKVLLKENHFSVHSRDGTGTTPLHLACESGVVENVKILLEAATEPIDTFELLSPNRTYRPEILNLLTSTRKK